MSEGHNPFLLDDETGFGSLPATAGEPGGGAPPPLTAAVTPTASASVPAPPRDPYSSSGGGATRKEGSGSDDSNKPLLSGGASSSSSLQGTATVNVGGAVTSSVVKRVDPNPKPKKKSTSWIFSAAFFQQYFDVDTDEVVARFQHAVATPTAGTFSALMDGNPDLYGPFWICATLIFLDAMGGNYAVYLSKARSGTQAAEEWTFDIKKVSISSAMFYGYVTFVPVAIYLTLRCFAAVNTSLVGLICTYGYALSVYVPVSLLCIVPVEWMRWVFFLVGVAVSSAFVFFNLRPIAGESPKGIAFATPFMGCVVGMHVLFGALLKLFFFQSF